MHGIDLMERRIAAARQRYPELELQPWSATSLPYDDGTFALVTQFTCLSSILDDDVRLATAHEMRRVARGGCVLSFDIRPPRIRRAPPPGATPTAPLDELELTRLFGPPALLRSAALDFPLAERTGRHPLLASVVAAVPFLRRHLIGVWNAT